MGLFASSSMALMALCLLCAAMNAHAACCTSGQPTYVGNNLNMVGFPTCSDGPCSGKNYNYKGPSASESENPNSCCDREHKRVSYNPPATDPNGKWPGIAQFPMSWKGTSPKCDATAPRYRCSLGGKEQGRRHRHMLNA